MLISVCCLGGCAHVVRVSFSLFFWWEGLICNRLGKRCGRNSLDDLRSDDLAGTAPGGKEVNDHEAFLAESGVEVGLAVNRVESVFCALRCVLRARLGRKCARARCKETYVVRLWTPVDMLEVEENVRLVLMLCVLLLVKVLKVVAVLGLVLNAVRGVTLAAAELA